MSEVVIIDTSVFCEILAVPGRSQNRIEIIAEMERLVEEAQSSLLLPLVAVYETGNHIAQSPGDQRFQTATRFSEQVTGAVLGEAPWAPAGFPDQDELLDLLKKFPEEAAQGVSIGDLSIVKEWENQCELNRGRRVRIWSKDKDLQGYDRNPEI